MTAIRADAGAEKSRVRWHCRRGMKELDVLLERFVSTEYDALTALEHQAFCNLLEKSDPDLYGAIMGLASPEGAVEAHLIERIREHKKPAGTV